MTTIAPKARLRVVMFAPHFVEYALRSAVALARHADVLAVVDAVSYGREVSPILGVEHPALRVVPFDFGVRRDRPFDINELLSVVAPFDPDVIHHQEQLPQVSLALMMRFRSRALQVLMVHDPLPHSSAIYALAPHTLAFLLRLRAFADLILVHGPANEEQLRRASPELAVPVKHVQHGVVLVPPPAMLGAPVPNSILMFGWLQEHKGMDVLLEACALLETARTTYSLTIAGSGPEPARLARQVASLRNVTVLEGFQPPDIAIALMQNASLVALPYRDATQSGVLASAFANGRPVVATRTGDIPRLVTDGGNGLLIPPQDPRGLAEAITRIFTTPGFIERLAAGAARTAMTEMNWDTISEDLSEAYFQGRARKAAGPDTSLAR